MKPINQFFHLLKYLCTASWWILVLPMAFIVQPMISVLSTSSFSSLMLQTSGVGMMCMMPMLLASMIFAPELFLRMNFTTPQTQQMAAAYSMDFLVTRPLDKPVIFSARYTFYWAALLVPCLVMIGLTFTNPSLTVNIPTKNSEEIAFFSSNLPNAEVTEKSEHRTTLHSPTGRVHLAVSMILLSAGFAAMWPPFVIWLSRQRFRNWIFWIVFLGGMLGMQLSPIFMRSRFWETGLFLIQGHVLISCLALGFLIFFGFHAARRGTLGDCR